MEKICKGCPQYVGACKIYTKPPPFFIRAGQCPHNAELLPETAQQAKIRVGQQKSKKRKL